MKKALVLLAILPLALTGCDKEESKTNFKNDFSIECKKEFEEDYSSDSGYNLSTVSTIEGKFNKKGYLTWSNYVTVETAKDDQTYKDRKEEIEENSKLEVDAKTKTEYDDANRTITSSIEMKVDYKDMGEKEKEDFQAKKYIENIEETGFTCEFNNVTKEEIGLK